MNHPLATIIGATLLAVYLSMTGCASMFSAKTEASYQVSPDGSRIISYTSDKEQTGLEASWKDKDGTDVKIRVDKSTTAESAIAAALQLQLEMAKLLEAIVPLAAQAAKVGALK